MSTMLPFHEKESSGLGTDSDLRGRQSGGTGTNYFTETTTIGIREYPLGRSVLDREEKEVETVYGKASVKQVSLGKMTRAYPEYDTVKKTGEEK